MDAKHIAPILLKIGKELKVSVSPFEAEDKFYQHGEYRENDLAHFAEVLAERAARVKINMVISSISEQTLTEQLKRLEFPLLIFKRTEFGFAPVLFTRDEKANFKAWEITHDGAKEIASSASLLIQTAYRVTNQDSLLTGKTDLADEGSKAADLILILTAFPLEGLIPPDGDDIKVLSPIQRFLRLLRPEKKDIIYIYIYAIIIGLINLSLPLGIQAIIGMISGGLVFNSVIILIALVILGILVGGGLQIMQITLVEMLQRRVFAKAAYEFAYRVPRFAQDHLARYYPPELMNRFFDVVNLQKGLPKLLIEVTAAVLQIVFGLLLLSLYHPFFVFFGFFLLGILYIVFRITSPKGMSTALVESKYKYKMAHWLQEMARAIIPFKMAGDSALSMKKTDEYVNNYLKYRKKHFSVLVNQYGFVIAFKTIITGGLLIMGTVLVVDRQITLGQFVASEIVIVTIVAAIEKIIVSMETIYDTLTATEKIGNVTDIPLERRSGFHLTEKRKEGMRIDIDRLSFTYPGAQHQVLHEISFTIQSGQRLCITGPADGGKNTLIRLLLGLYGGYSGSIAYNGLSLRDLKLPYLRSMIGENILNSVVYDCTILNNITMGRADATPERVAQIIHDLNLASTLYSHPDGLQANTLSGEVQFSDSTLYKLTMARALVTQPELVIIDDHIMTLSAADREHFIRYILDKKHHWTVVIISNQPELLASCDSQIKMESGRILTIS